LERTFGAVVREVLYQDGVLDVFNAREEKKSRVHFLCGIFVQKYECFFPCIVISAHLLYLLGRDDSRAENSHEEHEGIHVRACEILGAFRARCRRYVSLFFLFLSVLHNGLILEILKNKYTRNTQEDDNEREI